MTDTRRIPKPNNKNEDPAVDGRHHHVCWLLLIGLSQCEGLMFMLGTFLFVCALYQATHTKEDPASNRTNSQTEGTSQMNHNNYDEDDEEDSPTLEESDDDSASADPMLCLD